MSNLEKIIYKLLIKKYDNIIREKTFKDLRNGLYRFDFYLPKENICIEVHGEQHYKYSRFFYKKRSDFTKAQERDRRKITYCLAHNIKLYCIPYWDIENIKSVEDIFQNKFLAHNKFHNDKVWRERIKNIS